MSIKKFINANPWVVAILAYFFEMGHVILLSQQIPMFWNSIALLVIFSICAWRKWISANMWLAFVSVFVWLIATLHMDYAYIAWTGTLLGLYPMILLIERIPRRRILFLYGVWIGLMIYSASAWSAWEGIMLFWQKEAFWGPYLVFLALTFFLGQQLALFFLIAGHFYHHRPICSFPLIFALVYVLVEYWVPFPFPNEPALMLLTAPVLVQVSDLIGARSVTVIFCLVAASLYALTSPVLRRSLTRRARLLWISMLIIAPAFQIGYGAIKMQTLEPHPDSPAIDVAMIQPCSPLHIMNKDRKEKERVAGRLLDLSLQAIRAREYPPDLLVWPEGAGAIHYLDPPFEATRAFNPEYLAGIRELQAQTSTTLVLSDIKFLPLPRGMSLTKDNIKYHYLNHVSLIGPDGYTQAQYTKVIRLPFTEYLPLEETLIKHQNQFWARWARYAYRKIFPHTRSVGAGTNRTLFYDPANIPFAPLICYESLFDDYIREYVQRGAKYLVNVANEAWLGSEYMRKQSMLSSLIRGVENRVPLVRATNSGASVIADSRGVILADAPDSQPTFLRATINPALLKSPYTIAGYLIPKWILTPLLMILWIRAAVVARRYRQAQEKATTKVSPQSRKLKRKNPDRR